MAKEKKKGSPVEGFIEAGLGEKNHITSTHISLTSFT